MLGDRRAFRRRLAGMRRRQKQGQPFDRGLAVLSGDIEQSQRRLEGRRAALPQPTYPEELPVSAKRAEIAEAIAKHQVVVIAGETGSGKTTQIPKICLELGRGVDGFIGHTQPRRIAARSVAARIAQELNTPLGEAVGFKIRFTDRSSPRSHIRLMTDGILLAEIQSDPLLEQYDTLIIDEAHERSLNIDFLLGYLRQLLPKRPDLKLIITSATINTEAFSKFFGDAPVIEVSGRTYPVEVRYRPVLGEDEDERDRDQPQAIVEAVEELTRENPLGDILVFLPGEREIRETAEVLRKHKLRVTAPGHPCPRGVPAVLATTEIIPLFSRLSAAEQDRVFQNHRGRRIVLATNVAETSLTVPGIRFVIDTGYARISRYSHRTKVQRLPIEPIARASANQRAGRCGRVAAGICVRLYSEEDFLGRPEFTDPEIQRTNLASVILQMANLRLGEVDAFPFVDPPDRRYINDGYRLLHELHAVDEARRLSDIGRRLVRLPVDPRIGRMLLAAGGEGAVEEVLIIASALSIQDPRERPQEAQQKADELHRRFADEKSDFLAFVNLWRYYHEQARHLSNSKLRKLCHAEFLSYVRLREWHEVHSQLSALAHELGLRHNSEPADFGAVHRALLTGLLSHIGSKIEEPESKGGGKEKKRRRFVEYQGARGIKLAIFPGSSLAKATPKWLVAAELVETSRLFARTVAAIDPVWLEALAGHLLSRSYSEPHWQKRSAQVGAFEQVSLFGLVIVPRRRVNYGPIDPVESRRLFIRHALVEGDYHSKAPFFTHNRQLLDEIEQLEAKSRRRDVLVDEQVLLEFYDQRIPEGIYSGAGFEKWRHQAERAYPQLLFLTREALMRHGAGGVTAAQFPDTLGVVGAELRLQYHFEPGHPADGVTLQVPLPLLGLLQPARFEWVVPGLLEEKLIALIKSLPKAWRRNFVPAVNFARAALEVMNPSPRPLIETFSEQLLRMTGVAVPAEAWVLEALPTHLSMNFRVVDERGRPIVEGRDLEALKAELGGKVRETVAEQTTAGIERAGIRQWDFSGLPDEVVTEVRGLTLRGYPALVDQGESAAIRLFESPEAARREHRLGLRRLFLLQVADKLKYLRRHLPDLQTLCLLFAPRGSCEALREDILTAAVERVFLTGEPPRDQAEFEARLAAGRQDLVARATAITATVRQVLEADRELRRLLKGNLAPQALNAAAEVQRQVDRLVYPGFVSATPAEWLSRLPVYLTAARLRLEKMPRNPRDRQLGLEVAALEKKIRERCDALRQQGSVDPEWEHLRWLVEELRVSLFAQELGTVEAVSVQRLERRLATR